MPKQGRVLSGMRPTGRLHIGHLGVLENWVALQDTYECFYAIVDWHALTTSFDETEGIPENIRQMLLDWLSVGLDPAKSVIFVQSHVKEHAELHLLLSMVTPVSWLERVPTYKEQLQQFGEQGKDIATYGFLGYPLLQAADILVYKADTVPVGEDQLPHLELCREVARRFNYLYQVHLFPEPQAKLARVPLLPGTDGRKMSKSYQNEVLISEEPAAIRLKIRQMITDPARIHKSDPGHPEVCHVYSYHQVYSAGELEELTADCRKGGLGCVACKDHLAQVLAGYLQPFRERRAELARQPELLENILAEGAVRARREAASTLNEVRAAMHI